MHSLTDEKCILDQYSDVFTALGCAEGEYTIQLDEFLHSYSTEAKVKDTWKYEGYFMCRGPNWQGEPFGDSWKMVKNGSLRLCSDPPALNHAFKSEFNHPSSSKFFYNKRKGKKDY